MRNGENEKIVDRSGFFEMDGKRPRLETGGVSIYVLRKFDIQAAPVRYSCASI